MIGVSPSPTCANILFTFSACATGIAKCVTLPLLGSPDFTYDGVPFVILGFAECAVSIMAASIPALRALVNEIRGTHQFIQRMVPSLRLSYEAATSKRPYEDGSDATTVSVSPGLDLESGDDMVPPPPAYDICGGGLAGLSLPSPATYTSRSCYSSSLPKGSIDESILARSGLSNAQVAMAETTEAGDPVSEHDVEINTRRHLYNMQNVS
jgi:hypothetical protein